MLIIRLLTIKIHNYSMIFISPHILQCVVITQSVTVQEYSTELELCMLICICNVKHFIINEYQMLLCIFAAIKKHK